ncbi:MAG: hypothetical protein ACQKBY_08150 [Verrucomicrobiales bacterium]
MKKTNAMMSVFGGLAVACAGVAGAEEHAVAATIGETAGAVGSGVADAGRGLLKAPGKMLNMADSSLPDLSEGTQEFGVAGSVNWADDVIYNVDLTYGYFFRDNWQIGFATKVSGVESDVAFGLGLFTEYNWVCDSKWVPFLGFSAEWKHLDSDTVFDGDSIGLGLDLGVKYFIRQNVAVSFSIGADYAFDDVLPGGDDFAKTINIGTRFYF